MSSVARLFVAQMQDYLEMGLHHRTNVPGTQSGNWQWRLLPGEATPALARRCLLYTSFLDLLRQGAPFFSLKLRYQGETLVYACLNGKELTL